MRINFDEVQSAGFDALPSGVYHVKITDGEIHEASDRAKHPGSIYVNWEFTVQTGDFEDRRVWTNTSLDHGEECDCGEEEKFNKALGTLKALIEAATPDVDFSDYEFEIGNLIGQDLKVRLGQKGNENDEYGVQNTFKKFMPMSSEEVASAGLLS